MNEDHRVEVAKRLMRMQHTLATVFDACEAQAALCDAAGAKPLAFATHMVRESLMVYSRELSKFVGKYLSEDLEEEEMPIDL